MEEKGEIFQKLKEFITKVEVKWDRKTEIRCDNGKEYSSKEFKT